MTERYATGEPVQVGDVLVPLPGFEARILNAKFKAHEADTVERLDDNGLPIMVHDGHKSCGWYDVAGRFALVRRAEPERKSTPAIDISTIKAGDYVTVRLKVEASVDNDGDLTLERDRGYCGFFCPASLVVGHEPAPEKPLAVGDWVRLQGLSGSAVRVILAIDGDTAWTKRESDGRRANNYTTQLERVS